MLSSDYAIETLFFFFFERERVQVSEEQREREREREEQGSPETGLMFYPKQGSISPDVGLELMNHEIMT